MGESTPCTRGIHNPYTPGMPLAPGSPTFYGREDVYQAARQNIDGVARNGLLVLTGERRIGKTSVLKHLPAHLDPARYLCVYVDGNGLGIDPGLGGFYMAGHWVFSGNGVNGAIASGRHAVQVICKKDRKRFTATVP